MIENVIENLDKLYNDIKQEQEITQSSIQNNAKEILSEIGFEFIKIIPYFDETSEVTQNDSRVTFILKKIEKWNTYTLK